MTVALGPIRTVGSLRVAAITERAVQVVASPGGGRIGHGHLRPLALLWDGGAGPQAIGLDNRPLSPAEVEALCPGAWAAFR